MNKLFDDPALHDFALLVARVLLAAMFLVAGIGKITGYAGAAAYMAGKGLPELLLPLVILTEVGAGLMILFGWQTRLAAVLLAGFTIIASVMFHLDWTQTIQQQIFLKNMAVVGGFAALFAAGPGRFSVDGRRSALR